MEEAGKGKAQGVGDASISVRRGPRSDGGAGKEQILEAAAAQFGEHGYQATTIRKIAGAAGVDPKLVYYYFGSKENLFSTAIAKTFHAWGFPRLILDTASPQESSPGTRYLAAALTTLEDPGMGPAIIGLVRSFGNHEESRRIFLRFVREELIGRIAPELGTDHAEERVSMAGSQMLGVVTARYVLKIPPLVDLEISQVAAAIGPTIDRYIFGEIDWGEDPTRGT